MRFALAWALYWLGDRTDRWLVPADLSARAELFGSLYQWLMTKSRKVQGSGDGPWRMA